MEAKGNNTNLTARRTSKEENNNLRGYPLYSAGEDFYSKHQEVNDLDTDNTSTIEKSMENLNKQRAGF